MLASTRSISLNTRPAATSRPQVRLAATCAAARRCHVVAAAQAGSGNVAGLPADLVEKIEGTIAKNKVVAFIKGTKQFPQCGFSNTVVQLLRSCEVPFETVNILEDDRIRNGMKVYSQWPTFPQVYIAGEFVGGCDIMIEMFQSGALKEQVDTAMLS